MDDVDGGAGMSDQRFTADRGGWYRFGSDGWEYLGEDKPDDMSNVARVEVFGNQRRIYQNTGGAIDTGTRVIPNAVWMWWS